MFANLHGVARSSAAIARILSWTWRCKSATGRKFRKLLNRKIVEQDRKCAIFRQEFADYSDIVPATKIPREWEAPGEMTIRTTSRQRIGGANHKRGRPEWTVNGPSGLVDLSTRSIDILRRC